MRLITCPVCKQRTFMIGEISWACTNPNCSLNTGVYDMSQQATIVGFLEWTKKQRDDKKMSLDHYHILGTWVINYINYITNSQVPTTDSNS